MKGGSKVVVEPHRHEGIFVARGKEDALVTLNSTPGVAVYGEKRISVEGPPGPDGNATKVEYRVWNPFRSKCKKEGNVYRGVFEHFLSFYCTHSHILIVHSILFYSLSLSIIHNSGSCCIGRCR